MTSDQLSKNGEYTGILNARKNEVWKHNDLVQKSKFSLSLVERKTINFLISLIKPKENYQNGIQPLEYEFDIQAYCKICGIDYNNGENYKMVRNTLKSLRDKSMIMQLADGTDVSVSWVNKFWSNKGKGRAKIRFDDDIAPYLFNIQKNTTRFELLNILAMKSKYAAGLYELCKSWRGHSSHTYSLEDLRKLLGIKEGELARYPDFRRKVLEIAEREINEYTDLNIIFEPIKNGRKVFQIKIHIKEKGIRERQALEFKINSVLDGEK